MSKVQKKIVNMNLNAKSLYDGFRLLGMTEMEVKLQTTVLDYYKQEIKVNLAVYNAGLKRINFPLPYFTSVNGIGINILEDGKIEIIGDHYDEKLFALLEDFLFSINTLGNNREQLQAAIQQNNMTLELVPFSEKSDVIKIRLSMAETVNSEPSLDVWNN